MLGFGINSETLQIALPDGKIASDRVLSDCLEENQGSRALEVVTPQQVRGHIEPFLPSNAIWEYLTGPIDSLLQYTDERAICVNFPVPDVWGAFCNSMSVVFNLLQSGNNCGRSIKAVRCDCGPRNKGCLSTWAGHRPVSCPIDFRGYRPMRPWES